MVRTSPHRTRPAQSTAHRPAHDHAVSCRGSPPARASVGISRLVLSTRDGRSASPLLSTPTDGLALATRGLQKRYGSRVALAGLDLSVPTGVVYGFLGPNGAGKTTTMRLLTGLIHPDGGTIELLGRPFGRGDRHRLFEVGALIESPVVLPVPVGPREPPRAGRDRRADPEAAGSRSCSSWSGCATARATRSRPIRWA